MIRTEVNLGRRIINRKFWRINILDLFRPYTEISRNLNKPFRSVYLSFFTKDVDEVLYWYGNIKNNNIDDLDIEINFGFNNRDLMYNKDLAKEIHIAITPMRKNITIKEMLQKLKLANIFVEKQNSDLYIQRNSVFIKNKQFITTFQIVVHGIVNL